MFIERKINANGQVELWEAEWENPDDKAAKKVFVKILGLERWYRSTPLLVNDVGWDLTQSTSLVFYEFGFSLLPTASQRAIDVHCRYKLCTFCCRQARF